jgi:hypothetical protein
MAGPSSPPALGVSRHVLVITTLRNAGDAVEHAVRAVALQLAGCALAVPPSSEAPPDWPAPVTHTAWAFVGHPPLGLAHGGDGAAGSGAHPRWVPPTEAADLLLARSRGPPPPADGPDKVTPHKAEEQRAAALGRALQALLADVRGKNSLLLDVLWLTDDPGVTTDAAAVVADALLTLQGDARSTETAVRVVLLGSDPGTELQRALRHAQLVSLPADHAAADLGRMPLLCDAGVVWRGCMVVRGAASTSKAGARHAGGAAHGPAGGAAPRLRGKAALAAPLEAVLPPVGPPTVDATCPGLAMSCCEPPAAAAQWSDADARAWARDAMRARGCRSDVGAVRGLEVAAAMDLLVTRVATVHAILPLAAASPQQPLCLTCEAGQGERQSSAAELLAALAACAVGLHVRPTPRHTGPRLGEDDHLDGGLQGTTADDDTSHGWLVWPRGSGGGVWAAPMPSPGAVAPCYAARDAAHAHAADGAQGRAGSRLPPGLAALAAMRVEPLLHVDGSDRRPSSPEAADDAHVDALVAYAHAKWQALHSAALHPADEGRHALVGPSPAELPASLAELLGQQRARLLQALRPPSRSAAKGAKGTAGAVTSPPAQAAAAAPHAGTRRASRGPAPPGGGAAPVAATPVREQRHGQGGSALQAVQGSVGKPRGLPPPQPPPAATAAAHPTRGGVGTKRSAHDAGLGGHGGGGARPKGLSRGAVVAAAAAAAAAGQAAAGAPAKTASADKTRGSKRTLSFPHEGGDGGATERAAAAAGEADGVHCPAPGCGVTLPSRLLADGTAVRFCPGCGTSLLASGPT